MMSSHHSAFQSTRPLRGATSEAAFSKWMPVSISIHAPLAGRDREDDQPHDRENNFNPRAPCGARPPKDVGAVDEDEISIHAPLAGRDFPAQGHPSVSVYFNPRAPCGARPGIPDGGGKGTGISIHAPLAGRDRFRALHHATPNAISIHAPLAGRDQLEKAYCEYIKISIHAPLAGRDSKSAQKNAALLRKRYKYKLFVCKKCTSGNLTGAYSSKNTLYSGAKRSENPCALSVRTQRISGPSTSNPGLMPKCSILERYFSPR